MYFVYVGLRRGPFFLDFLYAGDALGCCYGLWLLDFHQAYMALWSDKKLEQSEAVIMQQQEGDNMTPHVFINAAAASTAHSHLPS